MGRACIFEHADVLSLPFQFFVFFYVGVMEGEAEELAGVISFRIVARNRAFILIDGENGKIFNFELSIDEIMNVVVHQGRI